MPRTKLSEYSTTNSSNTDIEGINIDEGCAPSGINNAIRELMVHLKEFQTGASGDAFTFAGGVLISGTANTITGNVLMSGTNTITGSTTATFAAGAVGTPSIAAHGDTNTGIFFPAADTIAFAEGGAEAMRIDSSGRVGIGTTAPSYPLEVLKNQAATTSISVDNNTGNAASHASLRLHTGGASSGDPFVYFYNEITDWSIGCDNSDSDKFKISKSSTLGTNDYFNIDSSGNVGIGTSSPGAVLDVRSSGSAAVFRTSDGTAANNAGTWIYNTASGTAASRVANVLLDGNGGDASGSDYFVLSHYGDNHVEIRNYSNGYMNFYTNNTERARITSGGYFKASDSGTYYDATGNHHEFYQTAAQANCFFYSSNASLASAMLAPIATRAANSAYNFFRAFSDAGGDTEFLLRGDGNGYADGTWNNNGADYAEFFESANGQALTLGATVVLDGNKVREATDQDPASAIIGVVRPKEPSKASMVVGNTAWNKWANKYLTDDFDRYIMEDHDVVEWEEQVLEREAVAAVEAVVDEDGNEVSPAVPAQEAVYKTKQHSYESHNIPADVTVPADAIRKTHDDKGNKFQHYKLNPAWDKDAEYVNRENRPEWNIIGLLGQVKILKGQPVGDRWIKMRDVSATVEEWMIR